jgi:large subunit ribosomal protein L24
MSLGIRKGDKVTVIAGKDKGKSGKVLKVLTAKQRVVVEGVNVVKKHLKRRSENEPGGLREAPAPLAVSNVSLFCGNCNRGVRCGTKIADDKSKTRICKKCQRTI